MSKGLRVLRSAARSIFQRVGRASAPVGWGGLRRLEPVSRNFGSDRGTPIDRRYIEAFLGHHAADVRGRTLEVGDATYTVRFGGPHVVQAEVLHAAAGNPEATLVGDLSTGEGVARDAFDCMVLTQVFCSIYDVRAAAYHTHAALREGGVLLATFPGLSQISQYDRERWGDYWRFTSQGVARLLTDAFGIGNVEVKAYGNVLAATAFLQGMAAEELRADELDFTDPDYEVLITARAVKGPR